MFVNLTKKILKRSLIKRSFYAKAISFWFTNFFLFFRKKCEETLNSSLEGSSTDKRRRVGPSSDRSLPSRRQSSNENFGNSPQREAGLDQISITGREQSPCLSETEGHVSVVPEHDELLNASIEQKLEVCT